MRRCSLYMSFAFCILFVFCPMTILVAQSGAEVETEIWTELEKKLEAAAQAQEAARSRKLRTEHRFRYVFSSDLGFLLGLNGPSFAMKSQNTQNVWVPIIKTGVPCVTVLAPRLIWAWSGPWAWAWAWACPWRKKREGTPQDEDLKNFKYT